MNIARFTTLAVLLSAPLPVCSQESADSLPETITLDLQEVRYTRGRIYELRRDLNSGWSHANRLELGGLDSTREILYGLPLEALTQYRMDVHWSPRSSGQGCRIAHIRIDLDIKIILPFSPDGAAVARLRKHEYEHRDAILQTARSLLAGIERVHSPSCKDAIAAAVAVVSTGEADLDEAHRRIDTGGGPSGRLVP